MRKPLPLGARQKPQFLIPTRSSRRVDQLCLLPRRILTVGLLEIAKGSVIPFSFFFSSHRLFFPLTLTHSPSFFFPFLFYFLFFLFFFLSSFFSFSFSFLLLLHRIGSLPIWSSSSPKIFLSLSLLTSHMG